MEENKPQDPKYFTLSTKYINFGSHHSFTGSLEERIEFGLHSPSQQLDGHLTKHLFNPVHTMPTICKEPQVHA